MTYWCTFSPASPVERSTSALPTDLVSRVYEHRAGLVDGFTKRYGVTLVYFEAHDTIAGALQREKNIKHWSREWKIDLIIASNPEWQDLYEEIVR
jgi:putative endonuclease